MDPAKLKVVELRAELSARGLDTKGVKAVLVDRLRQALAEETGKEVPETSVVDTSTEETSILEDKTTAEEVQPETDLNLEPERDPSPEKETEPSTKEQTEQPLPEAERDPVSQQEQQRPSKPIEKERTAGEKKEYSVTPQNIEMENVTIKQEPLGDDYKQHYEEKPDISNFQQYEEKKEHYEAEVKLEPGVEVKEERQSQGYYDDRKRKRSRSPQPQKQGWGQSGGWGRKDDEPELDNSAMVLGWYDSDLNLEIDRNNFLEATPMSNQGFGYIWAGCRATFGFNQGKVCYEVKLLENNDVTHLEDEPSPHVLRVGWSVLSCSMMLGEEPLSYGYGGTAKASTNCKFNNYGKTFVAGDVVTAYLDYGDRVKISYAVNGFYCKEAFNIPASQLNNQPLFPHFLSKNVKFQVNFGQNEPAFPVDPSYTWAAKVPEDKRIAGPRRPETREECEMLMMCGLPGCGKTTWANAYVTEHPDKFYNILGTNFLIDKMKIQGLPRKRNYHGRWDVLIDKCTKCLNKLLDMASKRRRNYILDQTNVYPSAQKRKMRNFAGFIRRAIVIVPTEEEFQRRCAKRDAEEGKDIPDSAVLEMKANFRLPEKGEFFDEVRYIELNEEESRPLVEQYNQEARAAGYGQQAPFSGQAKKFRPNDRPPFRGGGGGGGGGFRGGRGGGGGGGGGFGGGMDRRDRSVDRGPGGGRGGGGGGGFRSSGPPMKGGMDRGGGGRGGWQPRGGVGGDRGGRGGGGGGGWRDRSPTQGGGGGGYDRDSDNRTPGGGPWRNNRGNDRDRPYDRNQRGGGRGGGRGGNYDRDNNFRDDDYGGGRGGGRGSGFRDGGDYNRGGGGVGGGRGGGGRGGGGGGGGGGYDKDDYSARSGGYNARDGGFNSRDGGGYRDGGRGGGRGGGNRGGGGFDRDQRGGRGGYNDRGRGGGGGGFNDRRGGGGGNRDGSYDRNRGGSDRSQRDSKGGNAGNQDRSGQGQGWGSSSNQSYNSGWGQQGYNQQQQGYNQGGSGSGGGGSGYNQGASGGYNQGGGYSAQQSSQQQQQPSSWGQQGQQSWGNKGYGTNTTQQQPAQQATPAAATTATPAATGYNTAGYAQQTGYNQTQYGQGYWGQCGYGQGWTQVPK